MRGRKPVGITLPAEHVVVLQRLVRSGKTEQRVARRARILLAMHWQERVGPIAEDTATELIKVPQTHWAYPPARNRGGRQAV